MLNPESFSFGGVSVVFVKMTEGDPVRGFVPGYHFRILDRESVEVGHLNVRVGITEHVRLAAGHIGFGVLEEHRGHGYAGDACLAAAAWIATISEEVLITVDPGNEASIRTIVRIGGIFIDEVKVPPGDPHDVRGSWRKLRYRWRPGDAKSADSIWQTAL